MSASRKKQLRREENAAAMTEKQQKEMKEAKKLHLYTIIFGVAIALMICVVIVTAITNSGIIEKNTTAMTVNDNKINVVEMNYFYIDAINDWLDDYGSYASMFGLDTTQPLDEQYYDEEAGTTWADYFLDGATSTAKSVYAIYDEAVANGYTLDQETQDSIDTTIQTASAYALMNGFSSADSYIQAMYGSGADAESYQEYLEVYYTSSNYSAEVYNSFEYTDEELRAAEAGNETTYNSYSYNYYYLAASKFYEGGTTDEDGVTTYSDEEKAAGLALAEQTAKELAASESLEALDEAIAGLSFNAELESAGTTAISDKLYSSVLSALRDWVTDESRTEGDMEVIPNTVTSTTDDGEEVENTTGYYVVYFVGSSDNNFPLVNVRHILVQYEGGTTDEDGVTTYSDEEKAAAKAEAEELLETFTSGKGTADIFAELANENSDDTGSNTTGGLYTDVYPGQMVTNFNDWCFDESRQVGDTGIVESDYGYHVMYLDGFSDTTYRDYMITNALVSEDYSAWRNEVVEAASSTVKNTAHVQMDLVLSAS